MKRTLVLLLTINCISTLVHGVPLSGANVVHTENFDSLPKVGPGHTFVNGVTLPGWHLIRSSGTSTLFNSGTGASTAGTFYSFGIADSSERALGGLGSASFSGWIAASFVNGSDAPFASATVRWSGEQWRHGNTTPQTMIFEYGFGPTFASVSSWTAPGGTFDFESPVYEGSFRALDGSREGRVDNLGGELIGLNWMPGETLWLRWIERDDAGGDHGLAIDDFRISGHTAVVQSSSAVPDSLPSGYPLVTFAGVLLLAAGIHGTRAESVRAV